VDATYAYLWLRATEEIRRLELATGEITSIVTGSSNIGWYIHDGLLYFADPYDYIRRVPLGGGEPEELSRETDTVWTVATDGTRLFFGGYGEIVEVLEPRNNRLMQLSGDYVQRLLLNGDRLLFGTRDGVVGWVATDGSACGSVINDNFGLQEWASDEQSFFIAESGTLYRVPQ
jgi:hypothetical protein